MLAHRARPRQPCEFSQVNVTIPRAGFLLSSLFSAMAAMPLCAAVEHAAADAADSKALSPEELSESSRLLHDAHQTTQGSITIEGRAIAYQAEAGVLVVHVKDPMDDDPPPARDEHGNPPPPPAEASMSYVAYFRGDKEDPHRPITFLYNGGPGSSTVWLHMGAFGPKRVRTADDSHSAGRALPRGRQRVQPLDASDLVFIDAPGTGFGHLRGADKEKAFYGVDQDAHAFANFIVEFLSRHERWNSPKYLFGESYGTTRSAALSSILENEKDLDLNGIILLSQVLNFDDGADAPQFNPGRRSALRARAADLRGHGLVSPQATQSAGGARAAVARSRKFCAQRLLAGARRRRYAERRSAKRDRGQAARVHRPGRRLHRARQPARERRGIREDPARQRDHDGPSRYPLFGPDARSDEQGGGVRPAVRGDLLGLCLGLQRLRTQRRSNSATR